MVEVRVCDKCSGVVTRADDERLSLQELFLKLCPICQARAHLRIEPATLSNRELRLLRKYGEVRA